jgi:hypothetical protein
VKLSAVTVVAIVALVAAPAWANILVNPGFETGALAPWYQKADYGGPENWNVTTADVHSGTYSATDRGNKLIAQDFAAVATDSIIEASLWLKNVDASINAVYFQYSDLTTEENIWWPTGGWDYVDATGWLDPGKQLVSFGVYGVSGGTTERTYVDDWKIIIPEPSAVLLLGLGGALAFRRR